MSLNTGWKQWDKYLSKFVGKQVNLLEIGAYRGIATCWLLNNLATNPKSRVYAIDTWEGSPEYPNMNFKLIEKEFDENIKKTKREKQLIKMKMYSNKALIKLIESNTMFDYIFIDAGHDSKNVISDAILSWQILKPNGIIIFDDYEWDKLKQDYYKPKLAIDSFINIFKPELKILFKKYQVGIEKNKQSEIEKPELSNYYSFINRISEYKVNFEEMISNIDNTKSKLIFDEKFSSNPEKYPKEETNEYLTYIKNSSDNDNNKKYYNYELHRLLGHSEKILLDKMFIENVTEEFKKNNDKNIYVKDVYKYIGKNEENDLHETLGFINSNKLVKKTNVNFVDLSNHVVNFIKDIKLHEINTTTNKNKHVLNNEMYNLQEMDKIVKFLDGDKIDIIKISLISSNLINKNRVYYEKYYNIQFLYQIYFCLRVQEIKGVTTMLSFTYFSDITIQLLFILKKYYEKLYFLPYYCSTMYSNSIKIVAVNFKGIDKLELEKIRKICNKIPQEKYDDYNNKKYMYLTSIIDVKNNEEYKKFKKIILEINEKRIIENYNSIKLWREIITMLDKCNNKKLVKLKDQIMRTQLKFIYYWIEKFIV